VSTAPFGHASVNPAHRAACCHYVYCNHEGSAVRCALLCSLRVCSQMFDSAAAFSQNIAGWNVLRVSNYAFAFDSTTALADCYKKGMSTGWGTTLQAAYPTWSSLSTCTPRCAR
jgi:hypothetical protein